MDLNPSIKMPLNFKMTTLKSVNRVVTDKEQTKNFFIQMYKGEFSESDYNEFKKVKNFHNRIFGYIIGYLIDFNWNCL